jgi:hypothetical protein
MASGMIRGRVRVGLLVVSVGALLLAGCFQGGDGSSGSGAPNDGGRRTQARYSEAVPSPRDVELRVPGNPNPNALTLGETARFYAETYRITRSINGGVYVVLSILGDIVRLPPTEVGADYAVWGPWTPALEPTTFVLTVRQVGEAQYTYGLAMRPRTSSSDADWVAIIEGEADLSRADALEGRGGFVLDLSAYARLNPLAEMEGRMAVDYEHRPRSWRSVEVTLEGVRERRDPRAVPRDALYRYLEEADTSGEFQFAYFENVHGPLDLRPEPELVQIRSRWSASGAGRADARVSGDEIGVDLLGYLGLSQDWVQASECWDDGFLRVFYDETPVRLTPDDGEPDALWNGPGQGSAGDCVYGEPLFADDDVTMT